MRLLSSPKGTSLCGETLAGLRLGMGCCLLCVLLKNERILRVLSFRVSFGVVYGSSECDLLQIASDIRRELRGKCM